MDEAEAIVELDLGFRPEAAISGAVTVQTERSTFLTFNATRCEPDGLYHDAGTALFEFIFCSIAKFGYPNDEARWGIPRYRGLGYGIYEVLNSTWSRELTELNRYSFPDTKPLNQRHFLFLFHDSTFECVADDIQFEIIDRPYSEFFAQIARRVLAE